MGDGSSQGAGGASGSGGMPGSGGSSSSGPCDSVTNSGVVNSTIVVNGGQVYDGMCQRFVAGSALGDGSQAEGQQPIFRLNDGARLINVVIGSPAADGIHNYGNTSLENITWEDIGEDAMTIKASGTVVLRGGSARDGSDKVFQINAASRFEVYDFTATNAGKFIRQNGGTTFRVDVLIDGCDISDMDESIFRTDSSSSTIVMRNTRYSNIGTLFYDVNPANITTSGNTEY
jgi:pectate lyase C